MNKPKDEKLNTPSQVADPAELNADDLQLLNDGVLQQVSGGFGRFNNPDFFRQR